ncbi:PDDEXK nuclease domain-containing protein [Nitrosomonas sp. ANs5]|uniref:PDDEXK nuclease domain-containing protein n=1 Tax=Nitrosomonas sp. ANs5 TaxID=3423941 RepID=UPI003D3460F6
MSDAHLTTMEYRDWLKEIKQRLRQAQVKAAVQVNTALLTFYWELGADIVERQKTAQWGSGLLKQLSADLMTEFPDMKGFSKRNLERIRMWYLFYSEGFLNCDTGCVAIGQQPVDQLPKLDSTQIVPQPVAQMVGAQKVQQIVAQLVQIPWSHNLIIISKCGHVKEALYYVNKTIEHNWSRNVLTHQIESGLYEREGKAITNFSQTLPAPQSDLAQQLIKDPYNFDFLTLTKDYNERELEKALTDHITKFLLELGAGFAYVGRQQGLQVGERDFFLDLLFYHTKLHCYVVIELKTGEFEPEYTGKLNFYLKAVDEQLRGDRDEQTIGILLCKTRDRVVVEYALSDIHKPMGVSEYQLTRALPDNLKPSLPSIEELEAEFGNPEGGDE